MQLKSGDVNMDEFERDRSRSGMTRDRDLIIPQNQYAFILDKTKGIVGVCVGPFKTSLAGTDQPVRYDDEKREFVECDLTLTIKQFPVAKDGSYLVLENPAKDDKHPKQGSSGMEELDYGRKINIRGPVTFPLWAGQIAKVIPGHNLKSNEYLLVRVYNEEEATKNWSEAVIKPSSGNINKEGHEENKDTLPQEEEKTVKEKEIPKQDLTTGKQLTIKGTEVSFYIPPTGIEVLPERDAYRDANDSFVRKAVTLERLEYCILLDEDGNKRYVKGPAVVFPKPTETFITENNSKKFRAIELNEISGIYVKTIADYKDESGKDHKVGEELFITGKDQMIYYPRPEHAVIKYDGQEKHHSVAIPAGEARYVLNRLSGEIALKKGPVMFLPDPRTEVIVRRVIDPKITSIWFPGNDEALEYNKRMMVITRSKRADEFVTEREALTSVRSLSGSLGTDVNFLAIGAAAPQERFAGDAIDRKTQFTPPRMITLDTKYSGAVSIDVWTGYAILIIGKGGNRRVVVGPKTVLLEYDESIGIMELSTGKPKSDDKLMKTAYLRVTNNKVSDIITVETRDLVKVEIRLSYLVNFVDNPEKWFDVENYVKLLTQHLRSVINNAIKKKGIEEFYDNSTDIIRDTVLSVSNGTTERPGHLFKENGMHIYDVEVLNVKITDETIAMSLVRAQRDVVSQTLDLAAKRRDLEAVKEKEKIAQEIAGLKNATKIEDFKLAIKETEEGLKAKISKLSADLEEKNKDIEINKLKLEKDKNSADQDLEVAANKQKLELERIKGETEKVVAILSAIQPELIATMKTMGNQELAKVLAQNLPKAAGSFGLLTNKGGMDSLMKMVKDTPLEEGLASLLGLENSKLENKDNKTADSKNPVEML
jgi:major vault protein